MVTGRIIRWIFALLALAPGAAASAPRGSIAESEALLDGRSWQLGALAPPGRLRCVFFDVDGGLEHCILATPELGRTVKLGRYLEAGGLRLADDGLVLRGGLDGGLGYDSNQLLDNVEEGERGSGVLRALGHGTVTIAGRAPVGARLRLVAGYREHFAGEAPTGGLGGLDLDGDLLVRAVAGPVLRLELGQTFARSAAMPLTGARHRTALFEHTTATRARLLLGDLALHLEYQLMLRRAEERAAAYQDRIANRGAISLRWHRPLWLLRALSLNLSQQWLRDGEELAEHESRPFRGTLGLLARTAWFYAALELGYGASFVAGGDDYRGAIASTEVGGLLPGRVRAWLGFHHDFDESVLLDYLVQDAVFGGADFVVADGLLVVHQGFATRWRRPRGRRPPWLVGRDLNHFLTTLGFGAQLWLLPWLSLGLDYDLQLRMAPFERGAGSWSYVDHRVMVSLGVGT